LIPFNKLRCARNGDCSLQELNIERDRARSFKAISAGMLSPLGIIFGLFVVFTAVQVWQDNERANREVRAMRGSSDLIELNGDDLRRDVRNANAVERRPRRFKLSPGLTSVRLAVVAPISTGLIVHKQFKGAYQLKGAYHVSLRHRFNRRHCRHGPC
jgi:hypothetical protein